MNHCTHFTAERDQLLDMIASSANRGAAMVKHILAFARGVKSQGQHIPLSHLVKEMVKIVQDTFPKSILISTKVEKKLWNVCGDTTEFYQVLLNLCVNARDAMPRGGELTLTVANVTSQQEIQSVSAAIPPGNYVVLSVADTGTGIPPEVLPRIFEPLFSTKPPDKGTGLGLSTVAGIVKKHNGFIQLHSEVGKGTEFKIYLPVTQSGEMDKSVEPEKDRSGAEDQLSGVVTEDPGGRICREEGQRDAHGARDGRPASLAAGIF